MKKIIVSLLTLGLLVFAGCAQPEKVEITENPSSNQEFMQTSQPKSGDTIATITTNKGIMKAVLFGDKAPETVKNFTELAKTDKYDGTIFHRIIVDFMIQGGDFENSNGTGGHSYKGPGTSIEDEFDPALKNVRGALSMANRGPNTGGSQFFIVHAEATPWLDGKHAVFGQIYEGLDVLDEIIAVETNAFDTPLQEVVIEKMEIGTFE